MEEKRFARERERRTTGLFNKVGRYLVGMLTEVLIVVVLCAAAVLIMLVVKAVA